MNQNENTDVKKTRSPVVKHRSDQPAFLAAYAKCVNIAQAAETAGISLSTHYLWLQNDKKYRKAFALAEEAQIGRLEAEAWRRAVKGFEEPVFYKGVPCGTVRRYSDYLLSFLLKAHSPEIKGTSVDIIAMVPPRNLK